MSGGGAVLLECPSYGSHECATIILNRPRRGNAIDDTLGKQLMDTLKKLEDDPKVRVVVLTGAGKYFCTGMDLGSANQESLQQQIDQGTAGHAFLRILSQIRDFKKPIIARVNGPVMGGGCGVLFATDLRVMLQNSFLAFPEVKRGIVPALISAFIVPQMGLYRTKQYMLTGERVPASDLAQLGVISRLAADETELDAHVGRYVEELLGSAPNAMHEIKKLVQYVHYHSDEENQKYVQKVFARTVHSDEAMYGISCFLQKQRPDWAKFHQENPKSKL